MKNFSNQSAILFVRICVSSPHPLTANENPIHFVQYICLQVRALNKIHHTWQKLVVYIYGHSFGSLCWYPCNQFFSCWFFFFVSSRKMNFCVRFIHSFGRTVGRSAGRLVGRSVGRRSIEYSFVVCVCVCDFGIQCFNSEFIFLRKAYTASNMVLLSLFILSPVYSISFFALSFKLIDILECAPTI